MKNVQHIVLAAALAVAAVAGCRSAKTAGTPPAGNTPSTQNASQNQQPAQKPNVEARGVYLTGWSAGGKKKMQKIVDLLKASGMNAVVIDVKDSDGATTFPMENKWSKQVEAKRGQIKQIADHGYADRCKNIDWVMNLLKQNNIYPIARIAVFSDDVVPYVRPDLAIQKKDGGVWRYRKGAFLNPYSHEAWEYITAIAIEAAKKGFKEIQWDYVRFPTDGPMDTAVFPGKPAASTKAQTIAGFLAYSRKQLEPYGVAVSADIFGLTGLTGRKKTAGPQDMGIGQLLTLVAQNVDYICPMVYPSHFHKGEYKIPNPDAQPYEIVQKSLTDCLAEVKGTNCKIRPWLQNFSLPDRGRYGGSHYGPAQILAQIKASRDVGLTEFLMWDPNNKFEGLQEAMAQFNKSKPAAAANQPQQTPPVKDAADKH